MSIISVFIILIVIAAIALVLIVLVQNSKGGGLSSNFSSSNAIMGVRKTTDFLEKATWSLAGFIMVLSILCVMMRPKTTDDTAPKTEMGSQQQPAAQGTPDMSTTQPASQTPAEPVAQPTTPPASK